MPTASTNLGRVLEYFGITNAQLAKSIYVDPSLVCRWLSGQRKLKPDSPQMEALAAYILEQSKSVADIKWLKDRFRESGLPTDFSTVMENRQNLTLYLATDIKTGKQQASAPDAPDQGTDTPGNGVTRIGFTDIVLELERRMKALRDNSTLDLFLSSDRIATMIHPDMCGLLNAMIQQKRLNLRMVICVTGSTQAMSRVINAYMQPLISGKIQLLVVRGTTQTVTLQMNMIVPEHFVLLVTETPGQTAPPAATYLYNRVFLTEMMKSFEATLRYSQPALNVYGDDFSRDILEILFMEFATPGDLDVAKDSINPMYMTQKGYEDALKSFGFSGAEFAWRASEFARFKTGMDTTLTGESVFREIVPLTRLQQIVRDGYCRLPGLYFMNRGFIHLNTEGCIDLLNGYIRYLEHNRHFQMMIMDDIPLLHADSCWHIKKDQGVGINCWTGESPVMIYSDQLILLREFQANFDQMWADGNKALSHQNQVIAILRDTVNRLGNREETTT